MSAEQEQQAMEAKAVEAELDEYDDEEYEEEEYVADGHRFLLFTAMPGWLVATITR